MITLIITLFGVFLNGFGYGIKTDIVKHIGSIIIIVPFASNILLGNVSNYISMAYEPFVYVLGMIGLGCILYFLIWCSGYGAEKLISEDI